MKNGSSVKWASAAVVAAIALTAGIHFATTAVPAAEPKTKAIMYKPLQCGCCDDYARYLERNGFDVEITSLRSLAKVKRDNGVPAGLEGCHTLVVDGYTVDGLVPIGTLRKLLSERPDINGISLPGMPWGAPGMDQRPKEGPLTIYELPHGEGTPKVYAQE